MWFFCYCLFGGFPLKTYEVLQVQKNILLMFVFPTPNKVTGLFIHLNVRLVGSTTYLLL